LLPPAARQASSSGGFGTAIYTQFLELGAEGVGDLGLFGTVGFVYDIQGAAQSGLLIRLN